MIPYAEYMGIAFAALAVLTQIFIKLFDSTHGADRFSLRCWLGYHDATDIDIEVEKGMGMFGGPLTTFRWTCARCGGRGTT